MKKLHILEQVKCYVIFHTHLKQKYMGANSDNYMIKIYTEKKIHSIDSITMLKIDVIDILTFQSCMSLVHMR